MDNVVTVIIKFTGSWRGYGVGEVAGFPEDVAQALVEGGRAELYEQKKATRSSVPKGKPAAAKVLAAPPQPGPGEGNPAPDDADGEDEDKGDDDEQKP